MSNQNAMIQRAGRLLPRIERLEVVAAVVAFVAISLATSPAWSVDDGGGQSVFALGAGNRALGMGGAYVGLSNDASAPVWNAAGLGWVRRPELEFTQTSYFGVGMNEQFASIAMPHWRWGVASLTFRRFAVDGIEKRDDRNALLDTDLSDSQTEFLLGYGHRIGNAWTIGGVVKMRRQDLAGFNDSAVGLDLGVIVKPLKVILPSNRHGDRVTLGMSVRNAVQPELRLLQEKVADPTGVRLGTAVHVPIFGRSLLASFDVDKASQMDVRLHTGFELALHQMLALRLGFDSGAMTTGLGVGYRGLAIEYVFQETSLENIHRFGASFAFGPTVDERRQAAYDTQENELQTRFDAAFKERQQLRVRQLLLQADVAMSAGKYDEALESLAVVAALEPDNGVALKRQVSCLIGLGSASESRGDYPTAMVNYSQALALDPNNSLAQAAHDRARAESDRLAARSKSIRNQFAAAMDAFSEQRLIDAREGFEAILQGTPNDAEAAEMLARTNRAIDHRVEDLVEQANQLIKWEQFDDAQTALNEARYLAPRAAGVDRAVRRLADAEREATARDAIPDSAGGVMDSEPAARVLTDAEQEEASRLYQQAIAAMSEKKSNEAIRYLELVWAIDPEHQRVSEHLKREYLTRGMEYYADGALDDAVKMWEAALKVDPNDERAKGYLSRAKKQATRTREILGGSR